MPFAFSNPFLWWDAEWHLHFVVNWPQTSCVFVKCDRDKLRISQWRQLNKWPHWFFHSLPPVTLLVLELTGPCCWDFSTHFPRALWRLFLFTLCSHCGRIKPESSTLSLVTLLSRSHLRMNSEDFFSLLRHARATPSALEGSSTDYSKHRASSLILCTDSCGCWAKSFTASVLVQCIQGIPFQEESKWILCIYFRFNESNLSNYLHCIVIYKVMKSWNNWLNAIAKLFIECILQSGRDTSYYQTSSTSGFFQSSLQTREHSQVKEMLLSAGKEGFGSWVWWKAIRGTPQGFCNNESERTFLLGGFWVL